jgi:hypothetical protein
VLSIALIARFDDLLALAIFGPVGQVAAVTFVQHLRGLSEGGCQLLGTFETFVLALVHDLGLATVQATVDELAAGFQNLLGSVHLFGRSGVTLSDEFVQFDGQRSAFGLACFVRLLVNVDQAADARFEVCVAAQFEQSQELLDTFLLHRIRARVDARFGLSGDPAESGPGFSVADGSGNTAGAADVVLDERADFGAAFGSGQFLGLQESELLIASQLGLDGLPARAQARVGGTVFMVFSVNATENSQQAQNDLHFRVER